MGVKGPERDDDEFVQFYEPRSGTYKIVVVRDNKLIGAMLLGDISKVDFLTAGVRRQGARCPIERISMLFDMGHAQRGRPAPPISPTTSQVCNCNGVTQGRHRGVRARGCDDGRRRRRQDAGRQGLRLVQGPRRRHRRVRGRRRLAADPSADWYVPAIPMTKPELMAAVRETAPAVGVRGVAANFAPEGEDATAKMPLASLLRVVWGADWVDERGALFINDRVHANIQRDGTFSVVPQMKGGVTTPDQLRTIADVADKYDDPDGQGHRRPAHRPARASRRKTCRRCGTTSTCRRASPTGRASARSKPVWVRDFCRFGLGDSTALGIAIEERFQGLETPAKLKLAVTGCPRNCAEALCKDFGVVAIGDGKWEIYVGGAAGAHIRKGDLLATAERSRGGAPVCGVFIQYYRENGKWLERTYAWVPRVGIDELKAILIDDRDGLVDGLTERINASAAAYTDPWKERLEPKSPAQFSPSLPLIKLPLVPVR